MESKTPCKCGNIIDPSNVTYSNRENEIGESYYEVYAHCTHCKNEYETSGWGEIDTQEEAIEIMNDYISKAN